MARFITPAVTPLKKDGTLDIPSLKPLYEHLIRGGMDGILVLGSIGEFFALPMETKRQLIHEAVHIVDHRVELMVGVSGMVFDEVKELARFALAEGADAVIAVPPYYFWLEPASIEAYYSALAEAVDGPLYLYNFPDRTGYSIPPETVLALARKHKNIVGIKDTIAGVDHTRQIVKLVKAERPEFRVYSGFDDNFVHNVACGGDGCIAGLSNLLPSLCHAWTVAVNTGNWQETARIQQTIDRLMDIYAVGKPFVPYIKAAMAELGLPIATGCTFPLPEPTEKEREALRQILRREGLL